MNDKEIAKEITIAIIEKVSLIHPTAHIDNSQAIEQNGEVVTKLYKRIYDEVSNA
jgi:hypothetical protein